jgi:hypothetical protein
MQHLNKNYMRNTNFHNAMTLLTDPYGCQEKTKDKNYKQQQENLTAVAGFRLSDRIRSPGRYTVLVGRRLPPTNQRCINISGKQRPQLHKTRLLADYTMQHDRQIRMFQRNILPPSSHHRMLTPIYESAWRHIPENNDVQSPECEPQIS